MVTITKKGGGANPMYHDPRSGRQSSNHVTTGRFSRASSNVGTGTRWFTRSVLIFVVPMSLRILYINILKLTSTCFKKKGIFTNRSFNKNLYLYLHVLDGSLFCVSSQEFGAVCCWFWWSKIRGRQVPHMGPFWTQRGHILNHMDFHAGNEVTNPSWGRYVGGFRLKRPWKKKGLGKKKRHCA